MCVYVAKESNRPISEPWLACFAKIGGVPDASMCRPWPFPTLDTNKLSWVQSLRLKSDP